MSRTPTTTNESATQGEGEAQDDREPETPEVSSWGSSTPKTPAVQRSTGYPLVSHVATLHAICDVSHTARIACSRPYNFLCHSRPNFIIG